MIFTRRYLAPGKRAEENSTRKFRVIVSFSQFRRNFIINCRFLPSKRILTKFRKNFGAIAVLQINYPDVLRRLTSAHRMHGLRTDTRSIFIKKWNLYERLFQLY